ncbi:MAG: DUF4845 domain-containing protein [Gammaproteobacteria bacterium]|nr:DUF4845 domain-containing protein [Gammaproteobacteria bacterium]MDP2140931.1 DUF4845 domain-containing protein [Gammaproteobacteria bacterium]MDP2349325.1 DUF4845 domain-containing protein [Gammaproteobacteria bacterium]
MNSKLSSIPAGQRGFSKFGLIMTLVVLVCGLTFGLKVVPVYIDHNFVRGIAESLVESGRAATLTQAEIRGEIANSLRVNNIREFDLNSVTATRNNGAAVITVVYERRVPLFANVDVVVSFDDRIE